MSENAPTPSVCSACAQPIESGALRCPHCGDLVSDFKSCPQCLERVRRGASVCAHCSYHFPAAVPSESQPAELSGVAPESAEAGLEFSEIDFTVCATPLGGLICHHSPSALLFPPEMRVTAQELIVRSWSMLGLRSFEQRVPVSRVASVRMTLGVFWGGVVIETFGGNVGEIELLGLNKAEARDIVFLLQKYVLRHALPDEPDTQKREWGEVSSQIHD